MGPLVLDPKLIPNLKGNVDLNINLLLRLCCTSSFCILSNLQINLVSYL